MSALAGLKHAFNREKPHSSVTSWIDIMTGEQVAEESFEGIFELVDAISLQSSGPSEASRALRKKIKHGGSHQQYRAIVIMRSLLDNIPDKMKGPFAESQFIDILKGLWNDTGVNKRVKKRLMTVLMTWQEQYKDDPDMVVFASLCGRLKKEKKDVEVLDKLGYPPGHVEPKKQVEKEKGRPKPEVKTYKKKREQERTGERRKRRSFNFERDKDKVMTSIVEASQASSNLTNAIMRVNLETDTFEANESVQTHLANAKQSKKVIVRYTQLVENEELIGTLIETNDRLDAAINTYNELTASDEVGVLSSGIATATFTDREASQPQNTVDEDSQDWDNAPNARDIDDHHLHPDLADLDFNAPAPNLPAPIKPRALSEDNDTGRIEEDKRGSLSDYSDYESSDEQTYIGTSKRRGYVTVSDDSDDGRAAGPARPKPAAQHAQPVTATHKSKNPFADPFA